MVDHPTATRCTNEGEASTASRMIPTQWVFPVSFLSNPLNREISLPELAALCMRELNTSRRGEPSTDMYSVELLRRAIVQGDQDARISVQHCFGGVVLDWLRCHPKKAHACRLEREEYYVALAFERFWQTTTSNQQVECTTLAVALHYLRASLHGAILDRLRADVWAREISRSMRGELGESQIEDMASGSQVWEKLKALLTNPREQRLAYLLFHCGLSPREIVRSLPQEWSDVQEITRLRRIIMQRLLCHADQPGLVPQSCDPDCRSMIL